MGNIGMGELIVIFLIILLLFGANKLPEIGSSLGKAIREFKKAAREAEDDIKESINDKDHDKKS